MGEFDYDVQGLPVLKRDPNGKLLDKRNSLVNHKGYLTDAQGNIVDRAGHVLFERHLLTEGDVPAVFRSGRLRRDRSELDNLMEKIEEEMPEDREEDEAQEQPRATPLRSAIADHVEEGGTSYGSQMDESPSKYEMMNRVGESIDYETRNGGLASQGAPRIGNMG